MKLSQFNFILFIVLAFITCSKLVIANPIAVSENQLLEGLYGIKAKKFTPIGELGQTFTAIKWEKFANQSESFFMLPKIQVKEPKNKSVWHLSANKASILNDNFDSIQLKDGVKAINLISNQKNWQIETNTLTLDTKQKHAITNNEISVYGKNTKLIANGAKISLNDNLIEFVSNVNTEYNYDQSSKL